MKLKRIIRVLRRVRWKRVIIALIILSIVVFLAVYGLLSLIRDLTKKEEQVVVYTQTFVSEPIKIEVKAQEEPEKVLSKKYRLTSYYTNDGTGSGSCTGSGKCTKDFKVNSKGWYTYKGKLVVAAATTACLKSKSGACGKWNEPKEGRKYFKYGDEIKVEIDGTTYDAIVLDSCGSSMAGSEDRIDLFVSNKQSVIDRGYKGRNMITVFAEF